MAIVPSGVSVPAQSKELDNNVVTTSYGTVYRQVVNLADPETPTNYQRVGSNGAYVDVRNVVALPLPTGASTGALQTTGNATLSSIDTKTPNLVSGRVPVDGSSVTQPISAVSLPLPTGASTAALQTSGNASLTSINTKLPSLDGGYVPVTIKNSSIEISNDAGNPVPVSGTFWQATQPVSAVSLPLPTGAATEVTVAGLLTNTQLRASNVNVAVNSALPTGANTIGSIANTSFAATQSGTWNVTNISGTVSLPTGAATEATLSALSAKFSALGQKTMSASVPVVLASNHSDIVTKKSASSYAHLNSTGTTTIKSGAGILRRVVVNTNGSGSNTFTIYDNTSGSGTVIAAIDTVNGVSGHFEYNVAFSTGLTVVDASGTSADITVIYE